MRHPIGTKVRVKKSMKHRSWYDKYKDKVHTVKQYNNSGAVVFRDINTKCGGTGPYVVAKMEYFEVVCGKPIIGGKLL